MTTREEAAAARSEQVRQRADRPLQRRAAESPDSAPRVSFRIRDLELREQGDGGPLQFRGYGSVTDTPYEMYDFFGPYEEEVARGAFASSLLREDLDVPLVLQHQDLRRIARTTNGSLKLSEDSTGLLVEADLDPSDQDVQYIAPKLRSGLIDEMSFKFRINSGTWSPDYGSYRINDVDIHRGDVAIVGYGASPHTKGAGLRSFDPEDFARNLTESQARAAMEALRARLPRTGADFIHPDDAHHRRSFI